ncbi:MAG: carbon-nitrogen hydrolase family protein [Acidobacteriota bacterium]
MRHLIQNLQLKGSSLALAVVLIALAGSGLAGPRPAGAAEVKCAIVQYSVQEADAVGIDADRLTAFIREAAGNGAKLIVGPEATFYRVSPWSQNNVTILQLAQEFEALKTRFSTLASQLGVAIVIGLFEPSGDELKPVHNTALFIGPDGAVLGRHRKVVLADEEYDFGKAGKEAEGDGSPFATPFGRVGMLIGKDMRTTYWPDTLAAKGMDLFIGIAADPARGWQAVVHGCLKASCPGIAANQYSASATAPLAGKSGFVTPNGACIRDAGAEEKIIYATLPLK